MQSCIFMNKVSNKINITKNSKWKTNKDIKCNNCDWCQELKKSNNFLGRTLIDTLIEQNKIDLQLIQAYSEKEEIKDEINFYITLEKDIEKEKDNSVLRQDLIASREESLEHIILLSRFFYSEYLLENGVDEAKNEKFIYTNKFMLLAKDVV